MAGFTPITLEDLQEAPNQHVFPRDSLIALLEENGFQKTGREWQKPGDTSLESIYIPDYKNINGTVWRKIRSALEQLAAQEAPEAGPQEPGWIKTAMESHKDFSYRWQPGELRIYAKEAPEFGFAVPLSGRESLDTKTLSDYVETFGGKEAGTEQNLGAYLAALKEAAKFGWQVERTDEGAKLVSQLKGLEPIALPRDADISVLIGAVDDAGYQALLHMDVLKKEREHQIEALEGAVTLSTEGQTLTLRSQPLGEILQLPLQPNDWLAPAEQQQWDDFVKRTETALTEQAKKSRSEDFKKLASDKMPPVAMGQSVLILDTNAIKELSLIAADNNKSLLDILKATAKLPNVGKIIIPDHIADFEVRGIGSHYDDKGKLHFSGCINPEKYQTLRRQFEEFIKTGVRRHVGQNGKVEYLHRGDVNADNVNTKIMVWETQKGREMAEDIYAKLSKGERRQVYADYMGDRVAGEAKNFGEIEIEAICNDKDFYNAPVVILSSDMNYVLAYDKGTPRTKAGALKTYHTPYEYLDAELTVRGDEHRKNLGFAYATADEAYDALTRVDFDSGNVRENKFPNKNNKEADSILALIKNGVDQQKRPGAGRRETPTLPPPAPSSARTATAPSEKPAVPPLPIDSPSRAFGALVLAHMPHLNRIELAEKIAAANEEEAPDIKTLRKILSGEIVPTESLRDVIIDIVTETAPDREQAKAELRAAWQTALEENQNITKPADFKERYHGFGRTLHEWMQESSMDEGALAQKIRQAVSSLKPDEQKIDAKLILDIIEGRHVPSRGLALRLRQALNNPHGFDEAYAAAGKPTDLSKLRGEIRGLFHAVDAELSLGDIATIGGVGQKRSIGSLLGNGGNVTFNAEQLSGFGKKFHQWFMDQNRPDLAQRFDTLWNQYVTAYLHEQEQQSARGSAL